MDDSTLEHLEELSRRLGIVVRCEALAGEEIAGRGGLCRVKGQPVIFLPSSASNREKIRILVESLKRFDLDGLYVRPAIRELLEGPE